MMYINAKLAVIDFLSLYDKYGTVSEEMIENLRSVVETPTQESQDEEYVSISHLAHVADIPFEDAAEALQIMTNTQHNDF